LKKLEGGKIMDEKIQQADQAEVEEILLETLPEAHIRALSERARQERLDKIQQERKKLADLKQLAEFESTQAKLFIAGCKNILRDNLAAGHEAEWAALYNDTPYPPFILKEGKESQRAAHEKERDVYIAAQAEYNRAVDQLQLDYEKGRPAAIQSFARIVLNGITTPDLVTVYFDALYQPAEKLLVIDAVLPPYYDLPRAVSYQLNKEVEITPVEMSDQEFDAFYLDLIQQIALIAMDTIFKAIPARYVQWVGFNGLVESDETEDTLDTKSCIITCKASREDFTALNLSQDSPAANFLKLKGQLAKSLSGTDTIESIIIS
jgi:restriction system protein